MSTYHVNVSERRLLCLCSHDGVERFDGCFFRELYVVNFLYSVLETKCSNLSSSLYAFDFTFCIQHSILRTFKKNLLKKFGTIGKNNTINEPQLLLFFFF